MKLTSREYYSGDEIYINNLYKTMTNRDRNIEEYQWEWIYTWNGRGSVWLLFDEDRKEYDQLIGQYSIIPTPISVFGKTYLAGKTENCMMHPDYKGKGLYSPFEEKYFKEAKKKFHLFFTTTANIGAAWAVRKKLGYTAFDYWSNYYYSININYLKQDVNLEINKKIGSKFGFARFISFLFSIFYVIYKESSEKKDLKPVKISNESNAPLADIEKLWLDNKYLYKVSIDRKKNYLHWRINQNPYHDHLYLLDYSKEKLIGYLIFFKDRKNIIRIVDIFADKKNIQIYNNLLQNLMKYARKKEVNAISFSALYSNKLFRKIFTLNKFIDMNSLFSKNIKKKDKVKDFYVYVNKDIIPYNILDAQIWYVTDLFKEGR